MKTIAITVAMVAWTVAAIPAAQAAPYLIVTLTGTQSGPPVFNGQAGAGTLVRFGDDSDNCGTVKLHSTLAVEPINGSHSSA